MAKKKRYAPMLRLKMKRLEKGLTQEELAELVGVKKLTISNYERGERNPYRHLDKIAEVLGCSVSDLTSI